MKKYIITKEEYDEVCELIKANKNKRVDKRLQVIRLRYEGEKDVEIAEKLGFKRKHVSYLCGQFKNVGACEFARHKFGGNHRSLSCEKEKEILDKFSESAEKGNVVTVQEIKSAFDGEIGKDTGRGYIYMLLERHKWRMVMPRSKHPKKASDEAIEASKKLTLS